MRIELKEIQKMPSVFYVAFEFKAVLMCTEFWIELDPESSFIVSLVMNYVKIITQIKF